MDLLNAVILHKGAPVAAEVVAVERGGVEDRRVPLRLLLLVANDLLEDVLEVEDLHGLAEVFDVLRRPRLQLGRVYVDERAVGEAADAASALVSLQDLLMAEDLTAPQALQLVADFTRILPNLPALFVDGEAEVAINLDDSLLNQLSAPHQIDRLRVLPDVVERCAFR